MDLMLSSDAKPQAVEMPVELWVNGRKTATFLCTPYDLEDLAAGHMLVRGMVSDISEITSLSVDTSCYIIHASAAGSDLRSLYSVSEMILSGCSAVSEFSSQVYNLMPRPSQYRTSLSHLRELGEYMVDHGVIYQQTGGVHAALLESDGHRYVREDIGRHNAVDKAIGAAARDGVDFTNSALVTTGRISLDMALKAAAVSVPFIGTLKYPSDLGVRLAAHYGICVTACICSDDPLVYTAENKITPI